MAKVTYDPKVGDILYPSFQPLKAYKVTSVVAHPGLHGNVYDVQGINSKGQVWNDRDFTFNSFTSLVEETEKKAANHRKRLEKLKAL